MKVKIGSAKRDENGKGRGGQAGDQDGFEVCIENWYPNKKGWNIIRAKEEEVREKLAYAMRRACENDNIGYDKDQRYTAYNWCKKKNGGNYDPGAITEPVEVDCSALVRVCCAYAGIFTGDFYTGNEVSVLSATGKFDVITDPEITGTSKFLMKGDILVTCTTGHTAIVLNDGEITVEERKAVGTAYAKQNMRVRSEANLNGQVIGEIKKGEQVKVLEIYPDGWYKIITVDGCAYTSNAKNKYFHFVALKPKGYVATGNLNIRNGASTKYDVCGRIKKGSIVEVGPIVNSWAVLADGSGYSSMKYLKEVVGL